MRALVTGGAGFIGSHLALRLRALGHEVRVVDNFTAAHPDAPALLAGAGVEVQRGDLLVPADLARAVQGCEAVFHLAADPDVRSNAQAPSRAFDVNVLATLRLLEACRGSGARSVVFTSTSTVYGETAAVPTPETYGPCVPISLYGAAKLASEALLAAHAHGAHKRCTVLRLANVTGPRATHGVAYDLVGKLKRDPGRLEVLGDGTQRKSYIHIDDAVEGMLVAWQAQRAPYDVVNVGSLDAIDVRAIAGIVAEALGLRDVELVFKPSHGGRGWPGDVKVMQLDVAKLMALGWRPRHGSAGAIRAAAESLRG